MDKFERVFNKNAFVGVLIIAPIDQVHPAPE